MTTAHERDVGVHEQRERFRREYHTRDGRRIPDLIRDLRDEATMLVRQQYELAKAEISEKVSRMSRNAIYIAIGGFIAYAGLIFLLLAATFAVMHGLLEGGVATLVAMWLAPLIVGLIVAIIGYIFVQKGINTLKRESSPPPRTMRTLKEDKKWLEQKAHR